MNTNANARYAAMIEDLKTAPETASKPSLFKRIGGWFKKTFSRTAKDAAPAVGVAARTKRAGRTLRSRTAASSTAVKQPSKARRAAAKTVAAFKKAYAAAAKVAAQISNYVSRAWKYASPGLKAFYRIVVTGLGATLWISALIVAPFATLAYTVLAIAASVLYYSVVAVLAESASPIAKTGAKVMDTAFGVVLTTASVALFTGYMAVTVMSGPLAILTVAAMIALLVTAHAPKTAARAEVIDHGVYGSYAATA